MLKYNDRQVFMKLAEESSELSVEACKAANNNVRQQHLEEEIAHVRLYIDEVVERFGLDKKHIQKEYKSKLDKKSR